MPTTTLMPEETPETTPEEALEPRRRGLDVAVGLVLLAACLAIFANSLGGDFVYDDQKQIVANHLIQEPPYLWQALSSDVWAFKGEREEAWSNYWRPTFVFWLIVQHRLFGLESTFGWHLANILLHALVTILAYVFLYRLGVSRMAAAAVALLFAVHPVHVESVAWISGSPDLLLAAPLLGALTLILAAEKRQRFWSWARLAALALYAVALLAKEVAIVGPALVVTIVVVVDPARLSDLSQRWRRALMAAAPWAVLAILYLMVRHMVLGQFEVETPWRAGLPGVLLTAPSLMWFYLRQSFLPWHLGPSYPLRAVSLDTLGWTNFWLPCAALLGLTWLAWRLGRRQPLIWIGLAFFLMPLAPAFNIDAFLPEQLVHDRYLYLPVLGALLTAVLAVHGWLSNGRLPRIAAATVLALVCLVLGIQTVRYNPVWGSELALWERGTISDPTSAFNHAQHGNALLAAERYEEAAVALEKALSLEPVTSALLDRARLARLDRRFDDAERDLRQVLDEQPDNLIAHQRLALVYQQQGRVNDAAGVLRQARDRFPYRRCAFTSDLAVLHYLGGDKPGALAMLESLADSIGSEPSPGCHLAAYRLATLYLEQSRTVEARQALERYLEVSARATDSDNLRQRPIAQQQLDELTTEP